MLSVKPIEPALVNLVRQYLFPDIVDDRSIAHVLISFDGKTHTWSQLKDLLAKVAMTNDYNDLDNLPSIANIVNDAISAHNTSLNAHSNLFQVISSDDEITGLSDGGIYFEIAADEDETETEEENNNGGE